MHVYLSFHFLAVLPQLSRMKMNLIVPCNEILCLQALIQTVAKNNHNFFV